MATSSRASRPPRASPRPPCCPPRRVNPAPPSPSSPSASAADLSAGGSSRDQRLARRAPRSTRPRRPAAVSPTTPTPTPTTGPSSVQGRGPTRALRPSPTSRRGTEGGTRDVRDPQTGECIFIFVWAIIMMTRFCSQDPLVRRRLPQQVRVTRDPNLRQVRQDSHRPRGRTTSRRRLRRRWERVRRRGELG